MTLCECVCVCIDWRWVSTLFDADKGIFPLNSQCQHIVCGVTDNPETARRRKIHRKNKPKSIYSYFIGTQKKTYADTHSSSFNVASVGQTSVKTQSIFILQICMFYINILFGLLNNFAFLEFLFERCEKCGSVYSEFPSSTTYWNVGLMFFIAIRAFISIFFRSKKGEANEKIVIVLCSDGRQVENTS